jgi:hypothetical protein
MRPLGRRLVRLKAGGYGLLEGDEELFKTGGVIFPVSGPFFVHHFTSRADQFLPGIFSGGCELS